MLLSGKTALITGCLRGIGFEAMQLFARNGANIYACCQKREPTFDLARMQLIEETGASIKVLYFDFGDEESIKGTLRDLLAEKAEIDILLNIAGMTEDARFSMTKAESLRRVYEVNLVAQMLMAQTASRLMARRGGGAIVNVSSISALDGNEGQLAYTASKAAIIGATKTLATELAVQHIRVNAVAPGVIETAMIAAIPPEARDRLISRIPMRRCGTPSEVATVLLFLASDLARYVTGQVIRIDGGIG